MRVGSGCPIFHTLAREKRRVECPCEPKLTRRAIDVCEFYLLRGNNSINVSEFRFIPLFSGTGSRILVLVLALGTGLFILQGGHSGQQWIRGLFASCNLQLWPCLMLTSSSRSESYLMNSWLFTCLLGPSWQLPDVTNLVWVKQWRIKILSSMSRPGLL